jgi:hypothetical protein
MASRAPRRRSATRRHDSNISTCKRREHQQRPDTTPDRVTLAECTPVRSGPKPASSLLRNQRVPARLSLRRRSLAQYNGADDRGTSRQPAMALPRRGRARRSSFPQEKLNAPDAVCGGTASSAPALRPVTSACWSGIRLALLDLGFGLPSFGPITLHPLRNGPPRGRRHASRSFGSF